MGAPEEYVAQLEQADDARFEVWADNWDTVLAFLAVATQWRIAANGGGLEPVRHYWIGLDYAGVAAGLAGHGIAGTPDLWAGLRVMEAAARNALNGIEDADD